MGQKRAQPELAFQKVVVDFLERAVPSWIPWTAVGHGGGGPQHGARLKAMGVRAGWPDIIFLVPPLGRFCGLELKATKGRTSDSQLEIHEAIKMAGGDVRVCKTLCQVQIALDEWTVPLLYNYSEDGSRLIRRT